MRDRNAPLTPGDTDSLDWTKANGLIPAVIQDHASGRVLMLGYMNAEALRATLNDGLATFFSRSRQKLWQKGETSGNRLHVEAVYADCDEDTLLVLVRAEGPTCHTGTISCFGENALTGPGWLADLSMIVDARASSGEGGSYTAKLLSEGKPRVAQKVGEEGVELALAAVTRDAGGCAEETADLLYHVAVLMKACGFSWNEVIDRLRQRHAEASRPA